MTMEETWLLIFPKEPELNRGTKAKREGGGGGALAHQIDCFVRGEVPPLREHCLETQQQQQEEVLGTREGNGGAGEECPLVPAHQTRRRRGLQGAEDPR